MAICSSHGRLRPHSQAHTTFLFILTLYFSPMPWIQVLFFEMFWNFQGQRYALPCNCKCYSLLRIYSIEMKERLDWLSPDLIQVHTNMRMLSAIRHDYWYLILRLFNSSNILHPFLNCCHCWFFKLCLTIRLI
jgi:hypothetical protein